MQKSEALSQINQLAEQILKESNEPAVRVRLFRDIMGKTDEPEIMEAREQLEDTQWIKLLNEYQNEKGNFTGRMKPELRSEPFGTSFDIALGIGLEKDHPIIDKAKVYAEWCLSEGILNIASETTPPLTGRDLSICERRYAIAIAKVDSESPLIDEVFEKWSIIADVALGSGEYNKEEQKNVTSVMFDPEYNLRHALKYPEWILGDSAELLASRIEQISPELDEAFIRWYVKRHEVIKNCERFSSDTRRPSHKSLFVAEVLLQMEKLYGFRSWGKQMEKVAEYFWKVRKDDGFWNFGSSCANPYFIARLRFSDNWRGKRGSHDWTARIILLLHKYYSSI